jgi:hypothetical protein
MDFYRSQNVPEEIIQKIFKDEIKWIENDIHARPTNPSVLDKLPAP